LIKIWVSCKQVYSTNAVPLIIWKADEIVDLGERGGGVTLYIPAAECYYYNSAIYAAVPIPHMGCFMHIASAAKLIIYNARQLFIC
jgi:hypothetical protein